MNLETLVTKEDFKSGLDARFAEQKSGIDARFSEQKSYIDTRFNELSSRIDGNFRIQNWINAIIVTGVILPYVERALAL